MSYIYSGYQYADPNAVDMFGVIPMRMSSFCFLFVSFIAYNKHNIFACMIMIFNFITSVNLHKNVKKFDKSQMALKIDHLAITSWIVLNCYLLFAGAASLENKYNSFYCALYTFILSRARSKFQFRTICRDAIHCSMHLMGSVGTIIIL